MSWHETRSPKRKTTVLLPFIALVALVLFAMLQALSRFGGGDSTSKTTGAVSFPLLLEDGKLEIEQIFQFDGLNPDCGYQEGKNIAAITVTNRSDTYLASADVSMISADGEVLHFAVTDLPVGKSVMAFSLENASSEPDTAYGDVICKATFDADASMNDDKFSVSADGTTIILQNKTSTEIQDIAVYCRSTLGDQYFGGITHTYTVNNLPAYGTAELDAVDCILGFAEVVRIAVNDP